MSQLKFQLNRIKAIQSSVNILLVNYILHYMMQGYFPDGPKLFYEKTMSDRIIQISFLVVHIHKLFKSGVQFTVRWILRFLGTIFKFQMARQNFILPIKILNFAYK